MPKKHLKRIAVPKTWEIKRKEQTFITRPLPGGSAIKMSLPATHVLTQMVNFANTTKEVKKLLVKNEVLVNGNKFRESKRPIAFMDVLSAGKENFRITLSQKGKLKAISVDDANLRIVKIKDKSVQKKGKLQINCLDGTNLLVDKDQYKTGDTLVLEKGKIKECLSFEKGATILLTGGKHIGDSGVVDEIHGKLITYTNDKKKQQVTNKAYAFVTGKGGKTAIKIQ